MSNVTLKKRTPLTIILLFDMSESMAISLANIRNALGSLQAIAYKKRDRVGVVVSKGSRTTILQLPTTNLNLVVTKLKNVGASDLTPLAAGMYQSWRLLRNERVKKRGILPILVIISDGIANVPLTAPLGPHTRKKYFNQAQADVIDAAVLLQRDHVRTMIINPAHVPAGDAEATLHKKEIWKKTGKIWLDPTELLLEISNITGGHYYGINERGRLESVILREGLTYFNR